MLKEILAKTADDRHASLLLSRARESAEIYLIVSMRQKGCDGMGELAMIKEEFKEALDELITYSKGTRHLPEDHEYDLNRAALELSGVPWPAI